MNVVDKLKKNKKFLNISILAVFILIILLLLFFMTKYKKEYTSSNNYFLEYETAKASEIEKLNEKITSNNNEIDALEDKLNEYENSIDSLKKEKETKEKELNELNSKLSSTDKSEVNNLKNAIETKKKEIETISNTIKEKETIISGLQSQITASLNKITDLENEIKTLKETFQVVYLNDDTIVGTYNVKKGNNVTSIPSVPSKTGYDVSWSGDGKNISENTVIVALYTPKTYQIKYNFDFNNYYSLITGKVIIDNRTWEINYRDYKYVIEYLDEYDSISLPNNEGKVTVDDVTYILNFDYNYVFDENYNYLGDYTYFGNNILYAIEGKTFVYYPSTQKYKVVNAHKIRTDNVFVMDGKSYRIGGDEFKVYCGDTSYEITDMYFQTSSNLLKISNNILYVDDVVAQTITDQKFVYDSTEYQYAPNIVSIINKRKDGASTFKNDVLLPTKYTYGDKYFVLPSPYEHFNYMTSPSAHVNGWHTCFEVIDDKYMLLEDTYGDITIYLGWSIVS